MLEELEKNNMLADATQRSLESEGRGYDIIHQNWRFGLAAISCARDQPLNMSLLLRNRKKNQEKREVKHESATESGYSTSTA